MASKPNFRITKHDGDTGKRTTVGRHTTGDAAAQSRLDKRRDLPRGSSDSFTVHEIKPRRR
ncbi:hypothetical protein SAMN06264365_10999 [Actinoplanes regularis]|uniref:Uncharacterized protein n=2 Tax=Actinoplanes regularis TaxID=52697 RepID=A0A239BBH3_9ACTN|nr:hypothetical protein SAMN06264365_10999 [Actinoplanes regularis]